MFYTPYLYTVRSSMIHHSITRFKSFCAGQIGLDISSLISSYLGKMRARKLNNIQPNKVETVEYPLLFKAHGKAPYFQKRDEWRITDMLMNPMVSHLSHPEPVGAVGLWMGGNHLPHSSLTDWGSRGVSTIV